MTPSAVTWAAFPGYGVAACYMRAALHYWFIIEEIFALA
jgi:hypothetical protein